MNEDRATDAGRGAAGDRPEAKGVVHQAIGSVQDGYGRARERVRAMLDGAPAVRDVVATGRDYYHRGADAVTRSATDNTALTLFAAGVAVATVSWLILGPRRGNDKA